MSLNRTALYVVKFNIEKIFRTSKKRKTVTRFTLLHHTVLYFTLQYSTVLYFTFQYSAVLDSAVLDSPLLYITKVYLTLLSFTLLVSSFLFSTQFFPSLLLMILQPQRTRTSEAFRKATRGIMFSSDVTARGMDYPDVTLVLQVISLFNVMEFQTMAI